MRAARTLLERSTGVEVWKSDHCMAHLSAEARQLGGQLREDFGWRPASRRAVVPLLNLSTAPRSVGVPSEDQVPGRGRGATDQKPS